MSSSYYHENPPDRDARAHAQWLSRETAIEVARRCRAAGLPATTNECRGWAANVVERLRQIGRHDWRAIENIILDVLQERREAAQR